MQRPPRKLRERLTRPLPLAHAFLCGLPFVFEAGTFVAQLLFDLSDCFAIALCAGVHELFLEEYFPLRNLGAVALVDLLELLLLFFTQLGAGIRVAGGQAFHREFIGAFHGG